MHVPIINTERLTLRKMRITDREEIFKIRSSTVVNEYIEREPPKTLEEIDDFISKILKGIDNDDNIIWSITRTGDDNMIGSICFWNFSEDGKTGEIGYDLNPEFHRNGYMSEAIQKVIPYGFDNLNFDTIVAYTHHSNHASIRLLEKFGFALNPNLKDEHNSNNVVFELRN